MGGKEGLQTIARDEEGEEAPGLGVHALAHHQALIIVPDQSSQQIKIKSDHLIIIGK